MNSWDPDDLVGRDQLCLRCGRHEVAGSFCSFCRTADYVLADQPHHGHGCPLTWTPPRMEGVRHRHHPRARGYAPESDPPASEPVGRIETARPATNGPGDEYVPKEMK